ncbi:MAG: nitrate- and nitrite sensing domain-containing protein, partial [Pseudomonadota bacterium]
MSQRAEEPRKSETVRPGWRTSAPIYAVMLAPLAAALVFGAILISGAFVDSDREDKIRRLVELSTQASTLAHELQKERGMSAGFIASEGAAFGSELSSQRRLTDKALSQVGAAVTAYPVSDLSAERTALVVERAQKIKAGIGAIAKIRSQIDAQTIAKGDAVSFYTGLIRSLLSTADDSLEANSQADMAKLSLAYSYVLMAKEFAGVERAVGAAGFGSGAFDKALIRQYRDLQGRQRVLLERAAHLSDAAGEARIAGIAKSADFAAIEALRKVAEDSVGTGDLKGVTGPQWFKTSTAYLGVLKRVEGAMAAELIAVSQSAAKASSRVAWIEVASVALIGLFVGLFGFR